MEEYEPESYELNGKPYFITESETGLFKVVKSLEFGEDEWDYEFDSSIGDLVLGRDIREVPNRNISLLVRMPEATEYIIAAVEEVRKLA